jgi:two-component system phosphate regulon response regulator PhoB
MDDTVLLVEDETDVVDLLRYHFKKAGFKVEIANSGDAGLSAARSGRPDAVVLDLMLPGMTGLEVCRALKADAGTADIPVLMLTARSEVKDRVKGLETGADDYVTKPFSPKEVVLRVQGLLRRIRNAAEEVGVLEVDGISIDKNSLRASAGNQRLDLTTIEFKLLMTLINNRGRILSRETLLSDVWGYSTGADTRTVDTHMRRLREKLGDHASKVETMRGLGYRLNAATTP